MSEKEKQSMSRLQVTTAPHLHDHDSAARIMWEVNLALVPALLMALYFFGGRALMVISMSVLGAIAGEVLVQKAFLKQKISVLDGSAILTGILLSFCVPAALPWWAALVGGFVAIILGKQVYGGLGQNVFNPAHVARAVLLASWPVYMTTWLKPRVAAGLIGAIPDGITQATPLGLLKETARNSDLIEKITASGTSLVQYTMNELGLSWGDLVIGNISGSLGETSKLALILGGLFLLFRRHITWHIPVTMFATVFFGSWLFSGDLTFATYYLLAGGLFIGAFFMATDMVTSPLTTRGHLIFGFGCGAITLLIRMKGGYPEGVCYSILIMNAVVPLIDRFTVPTKFGTVSSTAQEAKA